ncbi:unnamed protein product, partial [Rotaria sp. Silwood1]
MSGLDPDQLEQQCKEEITIEDLIPTFGLFNSNLEEKSFHFLSTDSLKFLLFRLSFQVLVGMNHDAAALDEMCSYCRNQHKSNTAQLKKIDQFRGRYDKDKAIYYYTEDSFVYRLINQAFRSEDIDRIFKCRHYITHLHQHLAKQANQQGASGIDKHVYRGQTLPIVVLQKLKENEGKLISINGFLSVTQNSSYGAQYACVGTCNDKYASVIFEMKIDPTKNTTVPIANITKLSNSPHECEILFSIGSVWYLESVEEDTFYWTIKLKFCDDSNPQSAQLDEQLTKLDECLTNGSTYLSLGNILRALGDKPNAENFYQRMLDDRTLSYKTRGHIYYNIGTLAAEQGRYEDALKNIQKVEESIRSAAELSDRQEMNYELVYSYNRLPSRLRVFNTL